MSEPLRFTQDEIRSIIFQWLDMIGDCDRTYFDAITPEVVRNLKLAADKSSYLGRRFYGDEHRTEACPIHKGAWQGIDWFDTCPYHCGYTGWVPRSVVTDIGREKEND